MKHMADFARHLLCLPVLSVRQPWASYLVSGLKTVELRSWSSSYEGWLWIHAGKKSDLLAMKLMGLADHDFRCGGLLGLAKVTNCQLITDEGTWQALRGDHLSPGYYQGPCYGWHFGDALSLEEMIVCRGELGLFHLRGVVREQIYDEMICDGHQEFVRCAQNVLGCSVLPEVVRP